MMAKLFKNKKRNRLIQNIFTWTTVVQVAYYGYKYYKTGKVFD
ncbi:hypothetical protein [Croceiramulus getboli]|nr:hypothetical protein P8624_09960 [Flavobacteriaceae bacterium YJPT1-3]